MNAPFSAVFRTLNGTAASLSALHETLRRMEAETRTALRLIEPQGAFYAFVDVRACGMDCDRFSRMLLDEERVAVVPGTAFGSEGAGFVRLSYAGDGRELREGVRRMRAFAERHVDPALGRHTPGYHHLQIMA